MLCPHSTTISDYEGEKIIDGYSLGTPETYLRPAYDQVQWIKMSLHSTFRSRSARATNNKRQLFFFVVELWNMPHQNRWHKFSHLIEETSTIEEHQQ